MQRVLIIDTTILCCWLQIPGKETCGPDDDRWNYRRADEIINQRLEEGYYLVLPLATLLETGNHVAQAPLLRFECATELAKILRSVTNGNEPWAAFTEQSVLFSNEVLLEIADNWPERAAGRTSIGDFMILSVANYYSQAGISVQLLTGDAGLKAHEPVAEMRVPRRRG